MMAALLQTLLITVALTALSIGIEMSGCGENSLLEMVENSQNYNITCTKIGGTGRTVVWDRATGLSAGSCTAPNSCTSTFPLYAVVSRPNYSTSIMTVKRTTRQIFGNKVVKCYTKPSGSSSVVESADSCTVDVVVPAVLSAGSVEVVKTSPSWTLRANTTITTIFSSQGRYSCLWYTDSQSGASVGSDTSPALTPYASNTSDLSNRTGWCSSSWTMPLTSGNYSYVVVASPGETRQSAGRVNIERPASPSLESGCPVVYVPELSAVTCTCITSSLGSPQGVIGWSHDMSSSVLTLPNVNRRDHNTNFTCNVKWSSSTQNTSLNLKVAYGPDPGTTNISSTNVSNGVFDTDGSRDLHLTCKTPDSAVNPAPSYSWTQLAECKGQGQGLCTIRPKPPQNVTVTCTVTNEKNSGREQTVVRTIILNYPPTQSPGITGYSAGHVLYMNDPLSLTCDVTGGYPEVSQVTIKCDNQTRNVTPGQQGRLNVASLTASDHQATCTCSATWKVTSLYTRTGSVSLTVHSPPSVPSISHLSPAQFPYLEGDTPTLTCSSSNPGVPPATYTWSGHRTQDNIVTSPGASQLSMAPLTRHDNHRIIVCNATNDYTKHRGDVTPTNHNITVYYGPYVSLTSLEGNDCVMTSAPPLCVVTEGQRVHVQVEADSNPALKLYTWQKLSGSELNLGTRVDLNISSINRNHSGVYQVTVETEKPDANDDRLPLTVTHNLTVMVTFPASSVTLVNISSNNRTVHENAMVTFDCLSRGRPTPELQLTQSNTVLLRDEGGKLSLSETSTRLTHTITAQCHNTGLYTCSAHNGMGDTQRETAQLYVNCKPRCNSTCPGKPLKINYESKPVLVEFRFVAFPVPHNNHFTVRVNGSDKNITDNIKLNATCSANTTDYDVSCYVLISDVTDKEAGGLYTFSAANAFGKEDFPFEVIVNGTSDSGGGLGIAAIAGATCGAVVAVGATAVVVFKARQRRNAKKSQPNFRESQRVQQREEPVMIDNEIYGTSGHGKDACSGVQQPNPYEVVDVTKAKPCILPKPKTNIPPPSALPSPAGNSDVYAVVKKKTTSDQSSMANSGSTEESSKQGGKSKTGKKSKDETARTNGKGKQKTKAKADKQPLHPAETPGSVYSNMTPLSMSPLQDEGTVYENYAFNKDEVDGNETDKNRAEEQSEMVNPDGLVYTTIAFSTDQQRKAGLPSPKRETTEYAGIDFMKLAAK